MESRVMNDVQGKYILLSSEEVTQLTYENKMFFYNDIAGFLPFDTQRVNNTLSYQYRIMDYKTMSESYNNQSFSAEDVKKIFMAITLASQNAAEYLLNPDYILLNPDYIFVKENDFRFCYYPGEEGGFHKGIRELMEYILERLDHSRQDNVMMAYGLYQKILKNNYSMEMLMEEFCRERKPEGVDEKDRPIKLKIERKEEAMLSELENELLETVSKDKEPSVIKPIKFKKKGKDQTGSPAKGRKRTNHWWERFAKGDSGNMGEETSVKGTMLLADATVYGSTQLLGMKSLINQGVGKDIPLMDFPITIGSSAQTKVVLDNIMVSRIHAVITQECGFYYVEDQGSTNGTFVNGSRISPYEPVQIKAGDQITFANEKFCFN